MRAASRQRAGEMLVPVFIYTSTMDHSTIDIAEKKKQFFQRIKTETADLHQQTEKSKLSVALMSGQLKDYTAYLLRMKDIVAYYETNLYSQLSPIIPDIDQRRKLEAIEADLSYLNVPSNPNTFSLPPAATTAHLLGYMYVMEGSSLGGAMIYKHLSRHIDISEEKGAAYFTCYKTELGSKWKTFLDILGDYALPEQNAKDIIEGARTAFLAIHQHLA